MDGMIDGAGESEALRSAWRAAARRWELTGAERGALLPLGGEDAASPPPDTALRMRRTVELHHRLPFAADPAGSREWLRSPLPGLGALTPLELLGGDAAGAAALRRYAEWMFAS